MGDANYWPEVDRKGIPVRPGDLVSCPRYPKGTIRGRLEVCSRAKVVHANGSVIPALVIVTEDGVRYGATSKILLLKGGLPSTKEQIEAS